MNKKKCPICEILKPLSEYYTYSCKVRNKERISNYCKPCAREKARPRAEKHYKDNKEKKLQYSKDYRKNNPDKIKKLRTYFAKKYREELKECYVAECASKALKCTSKEIHENKELMQAYKNNIKLKRKIRNYGKE